MLLHIMLLHIHNWCNLCVCCDVCDLIDSTKAPFILPKELDIFLSFVVVIEFSCWLCYVFQVWYVVDLSSAFVFVFGWVILRYMTSNIGVWVSLSTILKLPFDSEALLAADPRPLHKVLACPGKFQQYLCPSLFNHYLFLLCVSGCWSVCQSLVFFIIIWVIVLVVLLNIPEIMSCILYIIWFICYSICFVFLLLLLNIIHSMMPNSMF